MRLKALPPNSKIVIAMAIESDPKKYQQKIIDNNPLRSYDVDLMEFLRS